MRKFYFNEEDGFENYKDADDEMEEEIEASFVIPPEVQFIQMANIELIEFKLNQKLLSSVIKLLEKNWFWRFKSSQKKLEIIKKTYLDFSKLLGEEINDEK